MTWLDRGLVEELVVPIDGWEPQGLVQELALLRQQGFSASDPSDHRRVVFYALFFCDARRPHLPLEP